MRGPHVRFCERRGGVIPAPTRRAGLDGDPHGQDTIECASRCGTTIQPLVHTHSCR